ncbi:MAG: phosphotransferase [Anaerolineales bacterium]|nr:phosphotransferase [Chloroflexota bacterium]MBL6980978.1 phosphotransferase [Anaerolineales bacterium]
MHIAIRTDDNHHHLDDENIIVSISQEVARRVPEWYGSNISLESEIPQKCKYPNSFFLRYQLIGFKKNPRALLVKIPREKHVSSLAKAIVNHELGEMAEREFALLVDVSYFVNKLKKLSYAAIRPLCYLDRWNAIVMEELPSRTLENLAFDLRTRFRINPEWNLFKDSLCITGRWMRIYHEVLGDWQFAPLDVDALILEIEQKINILMMAQPRFTDWEEIQTKFRQILENLRGLLVPHVNLHGDLFFTNVLITADQRVAVIDLARDMRGPIYTDLSSMIIELVEQRLKVSSIGFVINQPTIRSLENAILEGYSDTGVDDLPVLSIFCAKLLLSVWNWYEQRVENSSRVNKLFLRSIHPFIRYYLCREIRSYLKRAENMI